MQLSTNHITPEMSRYANEAVELLSELIRIPSFSEKEDKTADLLMAFLLKKGIEAKRFGNNVWAGYYDDAKPTLLLNSHHDTVKPNNAYTLDPFEPVIRDGKLFGLGSNDAGGPLVSLLMVFLHFHTQELPCNILFAGSAEEEISGANGMEALLKGLPPIDFGIVGEPTLMQAAVAEKGLLVVDGIARGKAGHAARDEGINALYIAMEDILKLKHFKFDKVSNLLGPVHLAVTSIHTDNKAHNVVPESCNFVLDIRVNELYNFEEVLKLLRSETESELLPRSVRLQPSFIAPDHLLAKAINKTEMECYGSPTCSDMALMNFPAVKIGPGDSARSHTADEFIYVNEIEQGIAVYCLLIENFIEQFKKEA